jgi:hypothetical protein
MKDKVMRPFRPPRTAADKPGTAKGQGISGVDRVEIASDPLPGESAEAPELGVISKPLVVHETERPQLDSITKGKMAADDVASLPSKKPPNMSTADWWDSVLLAEKKRLELLQNERLVDPNEILFQADSSDDDIPIAGTLKPQKKSAKPKKKMTERWTYVAVAEPTGIASNYWDASAPEERTTKRLAKAKLTALKVAENTISGES